MPSYIFYCPNKDCPNHGKTQADDSWFTRAGYHKTLAFGEVQRYRCKTCKKGFSEQTFSLNYWLKIKTDFKVLFAEWTSSNSDCFTGRHRNLSFDSIQLRRDRMARNMLFLQAKATQDLKINEPLCADGFESYTLNKFYPNNINLLVGKESRFVYYLTESCQKRKGNMTDEQKERCESEYEGKSFETCTIEEKFTALLLYLKGKTASDEITLHTDEHLTYSRVVERLNDGNDPGMPRIDHVRTSSRAARTRDNPLAAVNYLDRLIRKDLPNHRRKTVCQAKNDRNMLSRMICYVTSHNFFKPRKILSRRNQDESRHYTGLNLDSGIIDQLKSIVFTVRMSITKVILPEYYSDIWFKRTGTPFTTDADYVPGFAAI